MNVVLRKMNLPNADWIAIVEHALLVGAAAAITWVTTNIGDVAFGPWTPVIVAGLSTLAAWLNKILSNPA